MILGVFLLLVVAGIIFTVFTAINHTDNFDERDR